ncbi:MAG: hypothetical protein QXH27_03780 [Candidatus Micrarchaeia archaeon]
MNGKGKLALAVFSLALLFGCAGGPSQADYDKLRSDFVFLQRSCDSLNRSFANLTAECNDILSQKAALEAEKATLSSQISSLNTQLNGSDTALAAERAKQNASKARMDSAIVKLNLYNDTKTLLAKGYAVTTSELVAHTIKINALNDSQLNTEWDDILNCGACANASSLENAFYARLLGLARADIEAAKAQLG